MKINILYLLYKSKINKKGECPISCRITFNKKRKEFSTGLFVNPKYWDRTRQKVLKEAYNSNYTNTQLSLIKQNVSQAFFISTS